MATRILRHDHGTIVSGASYCFLTKAAAERESINHPAPRGVDAYADPKIDGYVYLAWSGEGNDVKHYGRGGHYVGLSVP